MAEWEFTLSMHWKTYRPIMHVCISGFIHDYIFLFQRCPGYRLWSDGERCRHVGTGSCQQTYGRTTTDLVSGGHLNLQPQVSILH